MFPYELVFALMFLPEFSLLFGLIIGISIYKLGDVGILSNLIGSLSLSNGHCPPPGSSWEVDNGTMAGRRKLVWYMLM